MLSHHSSERDKFGLPIVGDSVQVGFAEDVESEEDVQWIASFNAFHRKLDHFTKAAKRNIEEVVFIMTWLMPQLNLNDYPKTRLFAGAVIDSSKDKSLHEEVDLLKQTAETASANKVRLACASATILECAVSDISDRPTHRAVAESLHRPPQGYLRVWGPKSHTKHEKRLGFLCSSWRTSRPALTPEEPKQRGTLSVRGLQLHCEKKHRPSDWISLSGDVSWMLKYINKHWPTNDVSTNNMRIALVNTAKMERLNVLFDRSNTLVQSVEGTLYRKADRHGVRFAWHGHYLAYGWIPAQCIVKIFNLKQFRELCEDRGIQPSQYLSYW